MPFTKPHKQYLEAMGLVPWVRRDAKHEAALAESADLAILKESPEFTNRTDILTTQSGVIESTFRGITGWVHGESSAILLLVFEAAPGQIDLALNKVDNRLLLDMLKAIGLDERNVARCLVSAPITQASIDSICHTVDRPIGAALQVVTESPDITSDDQAGSRLSTAQSAVPVWQIAHPGWIKQEPALKRRAWNVLKAVRAVLGDVSGELVDLP